MATRILEAILTSNESVAASVTITDDSITTFDVPTLFPSLPAGNYRFRMRTPDTAGTYNVPSTGPVLSNLTLTGGAGTIDGTVTTDTPGVALVMAITPTDPAVSATILAGSVTAGENTFAQITGMAPGTYTATVTQGEASVNGPVTVAAPATATIADFSQDRKIFGSGASKSLNAAVIPVSGTTTAANGVAIQTRRVYYNDATDVQITSGPWAPSAWVNTGVAASGAWSGTVTAPRETNYTYCRVEVRAAGATGAQDATNRFSAGTTRAYFEQSNTRKIFSWDNFAPALITTITDENAVQIIDVARGTGVATRYFATMTAQNLENGVISPAVAVMANAFAAECPGEKLCIALHVQSATSPFEMIDDSDPVRLWSDEAAVAAIMMSDGNTLDTLWNTGWISWDASGNNVRRSLPIYLERLADGTAVEIGDTIDDASPSYVLTHSAKQLYGDYKIGFIPHGRPGTGVTAFGASEDISYENMELQWETSLDLIPEGLPYLGTARGALRATIVADAVTDELHYGAKTAEGLMRLAEIKEVMILQMERGAEALGWTYPSWTDVEYVANDGVYAWIAGRNVTTRRRLEDGTSTLVRGATINGPTSPVSGQIVQNIRGSGVSGLYIPAASTNFATVGEWGQGREPGLTDEDDYKIEFHKDLPVVDAGQAGVDVLVLPPRTIREFPNSLPAPNQFPLVNADAAFIDPSSLTATSALTYRILFTPTSSAAEMTMFAQQTNLTLKRATDGQVRLDCNASDGSTVLTGGFWAPSGAILTQGLLYDIVLAVDLDGGTSNLWINGTNYNVAHSRSGLTFSTASNRKLTLLNAVTGDIQSASVWRSLATSNDTSGLTNLVNTISAGAGGTILQTADPEWPGGPA